MIIFDGGQLDQHQVDRLVVGQHELSDARFFDVDQLAEVMPARLARRVIYAAAGHDNAYLDTAPRRRQRSAALCTDESGFKLIKCRASPGQRRVSWLRCGPRRLR